ncbi:MAG: NADP-binding protein, partial [bacterium]|nr:NADP-binding protein [bacterium]
MSDVSVILWGLGAMGSGIGKILLDKKGITIVGAIDSNPNIFGKSLRHVLGEHGPNITVCQTPEEVISECY